MSLYLLDTNLYVQATREAEFRGRFATFVASHVDALLVSGIVLFELWLGARTEAARDRIDRDVFRPFASRRRLVFPDAGTWRLCAHALTDLAPRRGLAALLERRSFVNDVLIAATARQHGATVITANRPDFEIIRSVLRFGLAATFPD